MKSTKIQSLLLRLKAVNRLVKCCHRKEYMPEIGSFSLKVAATSWNFIEMNTIYNTCTYHLHFKVTLSRNELLGTRKTRQYVGIKLFILNQQLHGKLLSSRCECKYYLTHILSDVSHLVFLSCTQLFYQDPTKKTENSYLKPVAGGRVVSAFYCYARDLPIKSSILPHT